MEIVLKSFAVLSRHRTLSPYTTVFLREYSCRLTHFHGLFRNMFTETFGVLFSFTSLW